jgi:hypothetical protein
MKLSNLKTVKALQQTKSVWSGSRNEFIRNMGIAKRGYLAESMVSEILSTIGKRVAKRTNTGHDIIVNGKKVEVKLATMCDSKDGTNGNYFIINQVRVAQDYDSLYIFAIKPNTWALYSYTKAQVSRLGGNQHGGKNAQSGTKRFDFVDVPKGARLIAKG